MCLLSTPIYATVIHKASKTEYELYKTLDKAYSEIKEIEKEIKSLKRSLLNERKKRLNDNLRLQRKITHLLKDKEKWIKAYESKKAEYDIFSLYIKAKGSHKSVDSLLEIEIRPIENLSFYGQIGVEYGVSNRKLYLMYKLGISYKLFGF